MSSGSDKQASSKDLSWVRCGLGPPPPVRRAHLTARPAGKLLSVFIKPLLLLPLFLMPLSRSGVAPALAGGPCNFDFQLSTVPIPIPLSPNGALTYQVRIVCSSGPVQNARVNVLFNTVGDSLVCWCAGSPWVPGAPHSFVAITNASGYATFNLAGGGCVEYNLAAIPGDRNYAAEVFADFVKVQECGVVSPDAVDNSGRISTDTPVWDPGSSCQTGLSDAVRHTTPLSNGSYAWCTDLNGDRLVTLGDGVILSPYLANSISCSGGAGN